MISKYNLKLKHSNHILKFGKFGIKTITFGRLIKSQIDTINYFLVRSLKSNKKSVKLWNLLFLNTTLTKLNSESRMGKGKGSMHTKAAFLRPGSILFEFEGITMQQITVLIKNLNKVTNLKLALVVK
uniref:ribosomal protein L16 n=1 Tax=Catenella fusiformis TaxID=3024791 RepID=UPI003002C0EB|nr:ribosomal protein L16 [Catenella fusiformis]